MTTITTKRITNLLYRFLLLENGDEILLEDGVCRPANETIDTLAGSTGRITTAPTGISTKRVLYEDAVVGTNAWGGSWASLAGNASAWGDSWSVGSVSVKPSANITKRVTTLPT